MTLQRLQHAGATPSTTLAGSISAISTVINLASGTGYPDGSIGPFVIKINADQPSEEKVLCLNRSGSTINVVTSPSSGRGWDGTAAAQHSMGEAVEHDFSANEADDANDHIYTTTRDDHGQYARTDGTRAFTGSVSIPAPTSNLTVGGNITASNGNITASVGSISVPNGNITTTRTLTAAIVTATGTNLNSRFVGQTIGNPATYDASGTFNVGDYVTDPTNNTIWLCTVAGTPGTWTQITGPTDTSWTSLTLTNSWASRGAPYITPAYRRVDGIVYLRGLVVGGTYGTGGGNAIAQLPTGYRPTATLVFPQVSDGGDLGVLEINLSGQLVPAQGVAGHSISLSCSFDTLS